MKWLLMCIIMCTIHRNFDDFFTVYQAGVEITDPASESDPSPQLASHIGYSVYPPDVDQKTLCRHQLFTSYSHITFQYY